MNPSTLIGMIGGIALIAAVLMFAALDPWAFVNPVGAAIVVGGTLAATFISYPLREVKRIFGLMYVVFRNERLYSSEDTRELIEISRLWTRGDIPRIEDAVARTRNPFLRTGVELVIAMTPERDILDLMKWRISRLRAREHAEAQLFRAMASFAPAFGMIGTLVGLINMLLVLDAADMSLIGKQMAVALMTTFYGILLANLFFKPIAVKLERRTEQRIVTMNMVMQGISMMCAKRGPRLIEATLDSFIAHYKDEIHESGKRRGGKAGGNQSRNVERTPYSG
jgi:chemotaxis protein MotA